MLNFIKNLKSPPKMFYRLKNLVNYFTVTDVNSERIKVETISTDWNYTFINFKFYSKLGAVDITLNKDKTFKENYSINYTTYAGTKLFYMEVNNCHVMVEPCMGYEYNIGAKEIDLAILELEDYLANEFGDIETLVEGYYTAERLAKESHREQIKYLEQR